MKKVASVVSVVVALFALPTVSFAQSYFAIGGGSGGDAGAANLSLEIGGVTTDRPNNRLLSFGLGFIFNADDVPSDTFEYPVPHSNYTDLGTRQKGNEYAFFGKYGLEIIRDKGLFLFALGGFSVSENVDLAQSNATGWYYEQSSSTELNGMFGGGLSYFPVNNKISLQVEYDNRRGVTGGIGLRW
ncbi:hypothetical protein [Geothermobacter hydrogeniphilus]|uniref:hypothetical protein n=1 Tax=Geothermobacter hydrogeniphilus TaxID=1969733 RepID=UPI00111BF075|nr:hypothetical protein [Geothermobacter hydrogeniphilus]